MKKLYIIKAGRTFPAVTETLGDFDSWTEAVLGDISIEIRVLDVDIGFIPPDPEDCAGVVITGSHAMVTDNLPWSINLESWLRLLLKARTPVFGICFGHQLLARAAGGDVGFHERGKEIGTVCIELLNDGSDDLLFHSLPQSFPAHATHSQTVLRLPEGAVRLASNSFEPNHAFCINGFAWGVQFHPEYTGDIMRAYIKAQAHELESSGFNVQQLLQTVSETPAAASILRNFAFLVDSRSGKETKNENNHQFFF